MGKASLPKSGINDTLDANKERKKQFGRERAAFSGVQGVSSTIGGGFNTTGNNTVPSTGLPTAGGVMTGPIAFHAPNKIYYPTSVNNNTLDISQETGLNSTYWIWPAGGSSTLEIISGAQFSGQLLFVEITQTQTETIKDRSNTSGGTTGNIKTLDGNDLTLGTDKTIVLFMFSAVDNIWHQVSNPSVSAGVGLADNNVWTGTNEFNGSFVTVAGTFTATGAVITLGDAGTDIINMVGKLGTDLNMDTNSILNASTITSSSADPADTGFIRMGNGEFLAWEASPAHTTDGLITYNSSERFQFNGTIAPDVSGGQTIGASGMEWGTVYAQSLDISGPVLFNDSALFSTIVSNLIPSGTRSLGDATDEWEDLRIDGIAYIDTLSNIGDIIVSADLDFDTGKYPDLADTSTSVSGTGIQLPLNGSSNAACEGFVIIKVNGATKKIPYYS